MKRPSAVVVLICAILTARSIAAQSITMTVDRMIDKGQLDDAERAARAAGDAGLVGLGDAMVARGRLWAADSVYALAVAKRTADFRSALAGRAELAARRVNYANAFNYAQQVAQAYLNSDRNWTSIDLVAAGRALTVLGRKDPQSFHDALRAFDAAAAADSTNARAMVLAADLFLATYNAPDARQTYQAALRHVPDYAPALTGLARVAAFEQGSNVTQLERRALAVNPKYTPAWLLLAQQHLEAEAYDSAASAASHALAIDSSAVDAWGVLGAIAWMAGDSAGFRAARSAAEAVQPSTVDFYASIAEAAGRQRRYRDAVRMAELAVRADSSSARSLGILGENLLRTGDMTQGRVELERAFAIDPYNLWHKNMLDLLDNVRGFTTVTNGRFQFVAPPDEAGYLATYLGPLLESAYDTFALRYGYRPPAPIRVELYGRHADFSVRTVGLTGLGALGVSFGTVLVLDSPHAREAGELNFGSTSWHELAHTFTLGLSDNRVPRWLSEGLSVLEERRTGRGWGFNASTDYLAAFKGGAIPAASHLNEGLVRPTYPAEIGFAYYQASLVCAMVEAEHGIESIRAMLRAYAAGKSTDAVLQQVLGMTADQFDRHFDAWVRQRFATALAAIDSSDGQHPATGKYVDMLRAANQLAQAGARDSARALWLVAQQIFPDDGSLDSPAWHLSHLDRDAGDIRDAAAQVHRVTMHDETAVDANLVESGFLLQLADSAGALQALERQQWITPYDPALHAKTAELAEQLRRWPIAIRERRAILDIAPPDPLEARFQLARVFALAGQRDSARREVLDVLERAPGFEKAQNLLLQLQAGSP